MDAERTVRAYLDAMERRDLAAAVREGKLMDQNVWNDMAEVLGPKLKPL